MYVRSINSIDYGDNSLGCFGEFGFLSLRPDMVGDPELGQPPYVYHVYMLLGKQRQQVWLRNLWGIIN